MEWDCYKRLCDTPRVFSRWMLEQTLELVRGYDSHVQSLQVALRGRVIAKPEDHKGGAATDMFELQLAAEEVTAIVLIITAARAEGVATSATRSRGLGGFVEAWQDYDHFLAGQKQ